MMLKSTDARRWWALACLTLLTIPSALAGCGGSNGEGDETNTITGALTSAVTEQQSMVATPNGNTQAEALRIYYEALIADLKQSLLDERSDRYMSEYEYEQRLATLEQALARLESDGNIPTGSSPIPGTQATVTKPLPETQGNSTPETTPETDASKDSTVISFRYRVVDGHAEIVKYLGQSRSVVIPSVMDGYPVTAIGDNAFENTDVTSVVIPSTVTSVGWFAFYGCHALESVTLPASVGIINYAAFEGCPHLVILCPEGSYAAQYALSFGIRRQYV